MFFLPAGNISAHERFQRLHEIKKLVEDGKTDHEIAEGIGMSLTAVKRNKKYLEDLAVADLTSEEIGEKRSELYLELTQAADEAQTLFERYRDEDKSGKANTWMIRWLDTIELRSKLYGLDNIKTGPLVQVNNLTQIQEPERISSEVADRIAKGLKDAHDRRLKSEYNA